MNSINGFLGQIAKEVKTVMGQLCVNHGKREKWLVICCYIAVPNLILKGLILQSMYQCMDNNVIVPVNSMKSCTLHNVGHESNVRCLTIAEAMATRQNERFDYCKYIPVNYQ